ncbi:hypothetical protein A1O1_01101 [Capronia coronata CBS 617.96]|uniref:Mid2 domain-containing protein n=1 Tax=Capronia coronata CBS 617.96 TaxID=1182541 RepID=W9Z319_9EURO|nr:uncharacterized protein A1O1_01101 [Capronia coronata CBS 617.96]EXJ95976.1 hypothetical protein A1O1_01101 [Capronia coronata CBS 617.96]
MRLPSSVCILRLFLAGTAIISSASASQTTSRASQDPSLLLRRQDDPSSCSSVDPQLPINFKCPSGANCISLDKSSSGLCCPEGNDCSNIQPISCDIQNQNLTANANANVFTTRLGDKLPTCGEKCCPFGYACIQAQSGPPVCNIIADTSKTGKTDASSSGSSSTSSSSAASTTKSTASTSSTSTSTATATGVSSSASRIAPTCNKFPIGVFLAGFFPGIFVGAFLMLAWVICSGRHRKPSKRHSAGSSVYKPTISDPIPMGSGGGMRTDFLRRTTGRAKSMFSTRSQISPRYTESHWKMPTPPVQNNIPAVPAGVPVTPERRLAHDSSAESIRVYSPPSGTVQPPVPAAIAPLRGMASQRYPSANNMGSPSKTPPYTNAMAEGSRSNNRGVSAISGISELSSHNDHEVLSPARYGGDDFTPAKRVRIEGHDAVSRPTTTFTEMLHEAGFPDPMQDHGTPAVPRIPDGYSRNRL